MKTPYHNSQLNTYTLFYFFLDSLTTFCTAPPPSSSTKYANSIFYFLAHISVDLNQNWLGRSERLHSILNCRLHVEQYKNKFCS